jgi:hypothetical protein
MRLMLVALLTACAGWTVTRPERPTPTPPPRLEIPEQDLSGPAFDEDAQLSPADRLFEAHVEAVGGRRAVESHRTARIRAQGTLLPSGDRVDVEERRQAPDQRLVLVDVHGVGSAAHGFDGRTAWATSTQYGGARYDPAETWRQRRIATFHAATRYGELYPERRVVGPVLWEGMAVTQVHVATVEGSTATLYFARDTGLLAGEEWWVPADDGGAPRRRARVYHQYKQRDDQFVPWRWTESEGAWTWRVTVREWTWDTPVDGFSPPSSVPSR